jgi:hypothetical protein
MLLLLLLLLLLCWPVRCVWCQQVMQDPQGLSPV